MEFLLPYVIATSSGITVVIVAWLAKRNATKSDIADLRKDVDKNTEQITLMDSEVDKVKNTVSSNTAAVQANTTAVKSQGEIQGKILDVVLDISKN